MEIALGTAQFGMDYGVTNKGGKVSLVEQKSIFNYFIQEGLRYIDTAPGYGDAETRVGELIHDATIELRIISKGSYLNESLSLRSQVNSTLERLKIPSLYGYLIHDFHRIPQSQLPDVAAQLNDLRAQGLIQKSGASLYTTKELQQFLRHSVGNLIQIPLNVLDWRFADSPEIKNAKQQGIEIHARSLFLQGILLNTPEKQSSALDALKPDITQYQSVAASLRLSPLEACWAFAQRQTVADVIVVGVENHSQLQQHVEHSRKNYSATIEQFTRCKSTSPFLDPRTWKAT